MTERPLGLLLSIGYGGRRQSDLVQILQNAQVSVVVDVRLSPRSRIPGFSEHSLRAALAKVGIEYRHERRLGNPESNRHAFRSGDTALGVQRFRSTLGPDGKAALDELAALADGRRVAVLCAERSAVSCHRNTVIESALQLNPGLESVVLE